MSNEPPTQRLAIAYGVDTEGPAPVVVSARRSRGRIVYDARPSLPRSRTARTGTIACLPVTSLFTRRLRAPFASRRKARKVYPSLLDIQLPCPLESCVYGFIENESGTNPGPLSEALGIAARREDVEARLHALDALGVKPEQLDHEGLALWSQSLAEQPAQAGEARIVCRLGFESCTLALGVGDHLHSVHPLRRDLAQAPLDDPAREAFARRARQMLQTHADTLGRSNITWLWTGPGADDADRVHALEATLPADPLRFLRHEQPATFLARALARRGLVPESTSFNFRRGDLAHPDLCRRAEQRGLRAGVAALLTGLLLLGGSLAWDLGLRARNQALQRTVAEAARTLSGLAHVPRGQEVAVVTRELAKQADRGAPFTRAFQPRLEHLLQTAVTRAAASGLELESLTLRDHEWTLRGTSDDWNRCDPFKRDLETLGFAVEAKLSEAGADERIHFTMRGEPRS